MVDVISLVELDEEFLDAVESILKLLDHGGLDFREKFSCCRKRLKELEEQERLLEQ
jgi:hypothetical protein